MPVRIKRIGIGIHYDLMFEHRLIFHAMPRIRYYLLIKNPWGLVSSDKHQCP
jgi:hypothetical protein